MLFIQPQGDDRELPLIASVMRGADQAVSRPGMAGGDGRTIAAKNGFGLSIVRMMDHDKEGLPSVISVEGGGAAPAFLASA